MYSITASADPASGKPPRKSRKQPQVAPLTSTHMAAQLTAVAVPSSGLTIRQPLVSKSAPHSAALTLLASIVCLSLHAQHTAEQQTGEQGDYISAAPAEAPSSACAWVCSERTPNHLTTSDAASSSTAGLGPGLLDSFLQLGQVFLPAASTRGSGDCGVATGDTWNLYSILK